MTKNLEEKFPADLMQSGKLLNKICSLADEVIFLHNKQGQIVQILSDNQSTENARLYLKDDLVFEDSEIQKKIEKNISHTISRKIPTSFKTQLIHRNKVKHLEFKQTTISNKFILTVISDVTALANLKDSISLSEDEIKKQNNIKSKFITEVSHKMRSPLNAVLGYAHLLGKKELNPEERSQLLNSLTSSARDMTVLMDDVINISLIINNQISVICNDYNINVILSNLKSFYQQKNDMVYNKNIEIVTSLIENEKSLVYIDSGRVEQIFRYLLDIAFKYSVSGKIILGATYTDDYLLKLSVDYCGELIPNKLVNSINNQDIDINKILDISNGREFLGLNIAAGLTQLLSGELNIKQSSKSKVSFTFTIPVPQGKLAHHTPHIGENYLWKNKVILIAEDEEQNTLLFKELFEDTKAHLIFAETGQQVVDLFETISQIDLLLLDVKMPVMSGTEVAQFIRESGSKIPIIVQTGFSDAKQKEEVMETGVNHYFEKPINVELLMETINDYLKE